MLPLRFVHTSEAPLLLITAAKEGRDTEREQDQEQNAVLGEGASIAQVKKLGPHVVILDIGMPVMNGLEAAAEIRRLAPKAKIVILTSFHAVCGFAADDELEIARENKAHTLADELMVVHDQDAKKRGILERLVF